MTIRFVTGAAALLIALLVCSAQRVTDREVDGERGLPRLRMSSVRERVMKEQGWSSEKTDAAILEYRRFWLLHKKNPGMAIVPSLDVDEVWHAHILYTKQYMRESQDYFGHYFHHNPTENAEGDSRNSDSYQRTLNAYQNEFGSLNSVWDSKGIPTTAGCGGVKCSGCKSDDSLSSSHSSLLASSPTVRGMDGMSNMSNCSGCSGCSGGMGPMSMGNGFHWSTEAMVLWDWWHTSTSLQYGLTLVGLLILMIAKEGLFSFRQYLARPQRVAVDEPLLGGYFLRFRLTLARRCVNAFLGAVNLVLGYFAMLIVMTYNSGFFCAIIAGAFIGLFVFSVPLRDTRVLPEGLEAETVEHDCCEK
jgi:hypothetical protein